MEERVLIIAEAGVNHNGDFEIAKKMIEVAKNAGADIIKFQTSITSTSKFSEKAAYQKRETGTEGSQLDMIKKLRFSFEQHRELKKYCDTVGIKYLSTPFDFESINFLSGICDFWKVPSGEIVNIPYLERIGRTGKPVVMSTGMGTIEEIGVALHVLTSNGTKSIRLLQCTTQYPTAFEDINLRAMSKLKEIFGYEVGLSDHSVGIEVSIAAVGMGATVIEKHFTLDRKMEGPDHKASIEPDDLEMLVKSVRNVEKALGTGRKEPCKSELENLYISRKSLVASRDIKKGEIFSANNIVPRHAGKGISPAKWYEILGMSAKRDFIEDEMIEL
ncbi:MAG: N-acetylneuraminate synthase [Anaeroplasmataceae bacterium]|nr:N-acetylneuraminate synthase [Anaeroplasmataceae bacterium]